MSFNGIFIVVLVVIFTVILIVSYFLNRKYDSEYDEKLMFLKKQIDSVIKDARRQIKKSRALHKRNSKELQKIEKEIEKMKKIIQDGKLKMNGEGVDDEDLEDNE